MAFLCFSLTASAQTTKSVTTTTKKATTSVKKIVTQEEVFTVYGNCNMCKRAIEYNTKAIDGVSTANWDKATDQMTVSFDASKTSLDKIKQKIADIGYDSDTHRSTEEAYNKLPNCCQYERPDKL